MAATNPSHQWLGYCHDVALRLMNKKAASGNGGRFFVHQSQSDIMTIAQPLMAGIRGRHFSKSRPGRKNGLVAGAGGVTVAAPMKRFQVILFGALLIATGVMLWIQHHSQDKMRAEIAALSEQNNSLVAANENLSNLVAQANGSQAMSKNQFLSLIHI